MAADRKSLWIVPVVFGLCGVALGTLAAQAPALGRTRAVVHEYPLPHHVPKHPGNLSLRFAMVHDVIHERFPRHGPDYYRARNREVEQALAKSSSPAARGKDADAYFALLDDRGVGLEFLGQHQEAVDLMRDKLKRQQALGYKGRDLYSTYANLGTFLILWQLAEGMQDVTRAKQRIGESVQWIHKAIQVYPESHFGREQWQVVLEEFLLAVLDKPALLLEFDMIGDHIDWAVQHTRAVLGRATHAAVAFDLANWLGNESIIPTIFSPPAASAAEYLKGQRTNEEPSRYRQHVVRVGAAKGWAEAVQTDFREPAPFDEPTLGIVGMWTMGAGANPHFSLALGEIMLRVGQRYIAWTAYERAASMSAGYWPDPNIQAKFAAHCRGRQKLIESELPGENWDAVRKRFDEELAFGQRYQQAYRDYEAKRLAEGARTDDPHFYDAFHEKHGPIATPPGNEDKAFLTTREPVRGPAYPWQIFFGGLLAFLGALAVTVDVVRQGPVQKTL